MKLIAEGKLHNAGKRPISPYGLTLEMGDNKMGTLSWLLRNQIGKRISIYVEDEQLKGQALKGENE